MSGTAITACILARNEERRIEDALRSLQGWTEQVIVIDNESDDGTVKIARRYTDCVLSAPRTGGQFDAIRNLAIEAARGSWIFYLDADERVPPRLGPELQRLIQARGEEFEALVIPFRHFFCGKWMEHSGWWPGYCRPQLLKKGRFRYNERLHSGVEVDGRTFYFPPDDPDLAIVHYSYDNLHHYLEKLNRYTDGEAASLLHDGKSHAWQAQLAHFVHDWRQYYEGGRADLDGMHGFVLSFMSAFYRFASRAKAWDLRRQQGEWQATESVPADLREMLEFMAQVAQQGAEPWLEARHIPAALPSGASPTAASAPATPLLWKAPMLDPSGYADEARNFVLGLIAAGEEIALTPEQWGQEDAGMAPEIRATIQERAVPADTPAELFVCHTLPPLQQPSPHARFNVARTMFETDRLPQGWEALLNRMDRVWVPSEFNRETFVRSGVDPEKIAVVPAALDAAPFAAEVEPWPLPHAGNGRGERAGEAQPKEGDAPYRFLSVFDWTLHKGWDVLVEAFAQEFGDDPAVELWIKTWSSNFYTLEDLRSQVDAHLRARVGRPLSDFPNVRLWWENIPTGEMPRLYKAVDAFVLPTRGEGWCRPLMEAMAAGLPTIATAWSGLTAFHSTKVGYPLPYRLAPVPENAAQEIPTYQGHCWAEPDLKELRRLLRQLVCNPEAARKKGLAAQKLVQKHYSRKAVTRIVQEELARCRELAAARPEPRPQPAAASHPSPNSAAGNGAWGHAGSAARSPQATAPPPFEPKANPLVREPAEPVDFQALLGRPLRVRWEGDQSLLSSLALVNREFCLGLLRSGDVELSLGEVRIPWHTLTERDDPRFGALFARLEAPLSGPPDVTVRHHFPPTWRRPETGKLVLIQPWEYGHLPREWVEGAIHQADEVWAYSRFVRDIYVRSGVPAEKIRVVPLGFNPEIFTPEGPEYPVPTEKQTRFLFVGGALDRKGADLLLEAYRAAFTRADDVCLIVKDMGTRTFYRGGTFADAYRQAMSDPHGPEVRYLDHDLSDAQLASLYRSCTAVALPYRGEGFGLPPLEGMACGLLPIVTSGGPTDDYAADDVALRLPHRRRYTGGARVGTAEVGWDCVGDPWQLEPDPSALVEALRWVAAHPEETREKGEKARTSIADTWTWDRATADARERLRALVRPASVEEAAKARRWSEPAIPAQASRRGSGAAKEGPGGKRPPTKRGGGKSGPVELSLCMIARDEEPRIAECLRSIAPHVDEMILVDTGSRDRTREIARDCGARVFEMPWPDSFADARNQSLEHARGEWIFWMDADDVIPPECGRELRRLIRLHPGKNAAYQVQVRIPPGPDEFSESIVDHVKLFPNRSDLRFEHRIHEQILPSIRRARLEVLFSDAYVVHRNYDRSDDGQAKKRRRDFRLLELDHQDRPDHPFVLFNLGMTYLHATKEFEVAAHYLRRCLERSHPEDSIVRKAYAMWTTARICLQEWAAAIEVNEAGRRHYPEDAELLFQAGQLYQQVGRFDEGRLALERLVQGQEDPHYRSVDTGLRTYRGWHELALLFRRMGDAPHCAQVLRQLSEAEDGYIPARLDLAETLIMMGQRREARQFLDAIQVTKSIETELARIRGLL